MGLGRGLASLIPKRDRGSADDVLEQIDSMEELDEISIAETGAVKDFRDLEPDNGDEVIKPPVKPNVSPIFLDPEQSQEEERVEVAAVKRQPATVSVEEEVEDKIEEVAPEAASEMEEEETSVPNALATEALKYDGIWDRHEEQIRHVPIGDITINPLQPRRSFDESELKDLQESIAKNGILQPLVVRRLDDNKFELIAGERRLRSAKALKWDKVPCVIRKDVQSDQSRLVFALIENIQRENLNPIEEALAYKQLNEDYGLTHEEIGERVGKSRVGVTNIVRVLQLPADIQREKIEEKITMGHAKAILMIPDPEKQIRFYHHLVDEGLTVRKAEVRARRIQRAMNITDPKRMIHQNKKDPIATKYGPALEDRYGYHATVRYGDGRHVFEVVFRATSEEELDQLTGRLLGKYELPGQDLEKDLIGE